MSEHKDIFKSASAISVFTTISRVTGFIREVLIANLFGTGMAAQSFFVAFRIPNMLREAMGEGVGNAAFVPVFSEYLTRRNRSDFLRLVKSLLLLLLFFSVAVSIAGVIFSPVIVRLIAPGFAADRMKFDLTVGLNRLLFPYLALVTLSAYFMSVSNALKSFALPASSSVIFNLVMILGISAIPLAKFGQPVYGLAAAVLLAGFAQLLMQLLPLYRQGVDFRRWEVYQRPFGEEAIRKIGRLILPRLLGTSIYQLNIFVDTIFASLAFFVGEGAIAAIYYANRIVQLPFSIFGVALSNAALPQMSAHSARRDMTGLKTTLLFCLKAVILCIAPATVGILILAAPLVQVIFQRGYFDAYSTFLTAQALFFYALGTVSYVGVRFFSHAFYALQDTLTPVKTSAAALLLNVFLNALFIFVFKMRLSGLALASSVSASVNFYLLYRMIRRRTDFTFGPVFGRMLTKSLVASAGMAVIVSCVWRLRFAGHPSFAAMFLVACLGAASYGIFLWLLRVAELKELVSWLRKRR